MSDEICMQCPIHDWRRGSALLVLFVALVSNLAAGQATQPAQEEAETIDAWQRAVDEFTKLAFARDSRAGSSYLTKNVKIESFNGTKLRGLVEVQYDLAGGKLVTARAYERLPQTLAADLASDIESSPAVPEEKKSQFIPSATLALERANATAAEWVRKSLALEDGDHLVAVVMVWHPNGAGKSRNSPGPLFMLVRARPGQPHEPAFQITHIVFGSPIKP